MKTHRSIHLLTATLGLAMLTTAGCADKSTTTSGILPTTTITPATTPTAAPGPGATSTSTAIASALWSDLKNLTFEARAQFGSGVTRLESEAANQIVTLNAKRAAMLGTTDTKAWDFAMKEMVNAQSYLKSTAAELGKATPDTWNQAKDKVGLAWTRTQEAYAKVKASTTS